jgi:hypothetical protein
LVWARVELLTEPAEDVGCKAKRGRRVAGLISPMLIRPGETFGWAELGFLGYRHYVSLIAV